MKVETRVGIFVIIAVGIFFYLSLNIGAIRFNQRHYYHYKTFFDDTGGLDEKAPVKIAGVEMGWVESIRLLEGGKAEVNLKIYKDAKLARNAYATIQQEGLIGSKSIDIEPGDPTTGHLPPGSVLALPGRSPTSVGDLLEQFKDIASGINDIVSSFKNTFATQKGEDSLKLALNSVAQASTQIANFSEILERTLQKNEDNINSMVVDFKETAYHLKKGVPSITNDFKSITNSLQDQVFPSITSGVDRVTIALADETLPQLRNNMDMVSDKAGTAFDSIDSSAIQAGDTFKEAKQVMEKINTGKGVLGKLITEDETYTDLKKTVHGFKEMVNKSQTLDILIDMHTESMFKTNNSKGYLEAKLRPSNDYFYNLQLVSDENGSIKKIEQRYKRYDSHGNLLKTDNITDPYEKIISADRVEETKQIKNDILFGFQFGKRFNRVALRIGMFENTFGFGCDYYVPLNTDKFHWITTLEAFDLKGSNRMNDTRPHIKWLNKLYFMKHIYTSFGIDDIYSKHNASPFFGGGIRFGDEDIKYLLSYLPTGGVTKT